MAISSTVKIDAGKDIVKELSRIAAEENLKYAFITGCRGMLKNVTLIVGGLNSGLTNLSIGEPCRVEMMNGKIEKIKGNLDVNIRAVFSRNGSRLGDGQIVKAETSGDFEVDLNKVNMGKIIIG